MTIAASACEAFLNVIVEELGITRRCDQGCHEGHCPHGCPDVWEDCGCWCHQEISAGQRWKALRVDHCDHGPVVDAGFCGEWCEHQQ